MHSSSQQADISKKVQAGRRKSRNKTTSRAQPEKRSSRIQTPASPNSTLMSPAVNDGGWYITISLYHHCYRMDRPASYLCWNKHMIIVVDTLRVLHGADWQKNPRKTRYIVVPVQWFDGWVGTWGPRNFAAVLEIRIAWIDANSGGCIIDYRRYRSSESGGYLKRWLVCRCGVGSLIHTRTWTWTRKCIQVQVWLIIKVTSR